MAVWYKIQEPGDSAPFAVVYLDDNFYLRRYVPGQGLVYWPSMIEWVGPGGDLGGIPIGQKEALALIRAGVGKLKPGQVVPDSQGVSPIAVPG